ncbi:MAG: hypothetical protein PVJ27_09540, partial [Candidatus Brocadiaceae bacterium]
FNLGLARRRAEPTGGGRPRRVEGAPGAEATVEARAARPGSPGGRPGRRIPEGAIGYPGGRKPGPRPVESVLEAVTSADTGPVLGEGRIGRVPSGRDW